MERGPTTALPSTQIDPATMKALKSLVLSIPVVGDILVNLTA